MPARNAYVKTSAGWEQIATTFQAIPSGLVPIIPTSVTNGSFTSDGQITYSAQSTVSVNGAFSSAFDNYQIIFELDTGSVANGANMRLRAAGTDQSTGTNYDVNVMFGSNGSSTISNTQTLGGTSWALGVTNTRTRRYAVMTISKPFLADYTVGLVQSTQWDATTGNNFIALSSNSHRLQTSYDGFSIIASTGTMTGSMKIYGYSKSGLNQPLTLQQPSPNYLINGGFDFWQRGTSSTTNAVYIADRWLHSRSAGTHTVSQSTDTPAEADLQYSLSFASTSGTSPTITQRIESVNSFQFASQKVTFSIWAKSTVGTGGLAWSTSYPTVIDNWAAETADTSGTFTATMTVGSWTRYTATFTANALATRGYAIKVFRNVTTTSTTTLYAGALLELGSSVTQFRRAGSTYTEEQTACFRYYQRHITIMGRTDNTNVWKIIGNPIGELLRATPTSVTVGTIATPGSGGNIGTNVTLTLSGRDMYYTSVGSSSNGAWLNFDDTKVECEL